MCQASHRRHRCCAKKQQVQPRPYTRGAVGQSQQRGTRASHMLAARLPRGVDSKVYMYKPSGRLAPHVGGAPRPCYSGRRREGALTAATGIRANIG